MSTGVINKNGYIQECISGLYKSSSRRKPDPAVANGEYQIKQLLEQHNWIAMSIFIYEDTLIIYGECRGAEAIPCGLFPVIEAHLSDIAADKDCKWRRMWDIFHYSSIGGEEQWRRKITGKKAEMRLNRIKPEMFSGYVFYHYQLQEEKPGLDDKYGIISFDDGLMSFYQEYPAEIEKSALPGKLSTNNSPLDTWEELMSEHFIPWEDFDRPWRPMKCVFSVIPT